MQALSVALSFVSYTCVLIEIIDDIVSESALGFSYVDAYENEVRALIDLVGVIDDILAINDVFDI